MSFPNRSTLLVLSVAVLCAAASAAGKGGVAKKGKSMEEPTKNYALKLTCNDSYISGFPLLVGVEVSNISRTHHTELPVFDVFTVPGYVRFVLRGGGREWAWPTRHWPRDEEPGLTEFRPGHAWFALQDLSEAHPDIPPGKYRLSASIIFSGDLVEAGPVAIEVRAASKEDREIAAKLRANDNDNGSSWLDRVSRDPTGRSTEGLSAAARAALDYYLYLHEVESSAQPLSSLQPNETDRFAHGALEAEAAVLRLELLYAAGRPEAPGIEAAVLERWPGLAWRVEDIRKGRGLLTGLQAYARKRASRK